MKGIRRLALCLLLGILAACGPATAPATPAPGLTPTAPSTPTPSSTATPVPSPTPPPIHLAADGSGDYATLEAALAAASPGATIVLEAGDYRLATRVEITKSVRLVGAGMDLTSVIGAHTDYVLHLRGSGPFIAEDITFRHESTLGADVVVVTGGEVTFSRCRFTGAGSRVNGDDHAGLHLRGDSRGTVWDCEATKNNVAGIMVEGRSAVTLTGNLCTDNVFYGIEYVGSVRGAARQNECRGNYVGIAVDGPAQPLIEDNICAGNESAGVEVGGTSRATVRQNDCSGGLIGIGVRQKAQPTIEGNSCHGNSQDGIAILDSAGGIVRQNESTRNDLFGIYVAGQAEPTLEENDCYGNKQAGIAFRGWSKGVAAGNECKRNGIAGIYVGEQARPTLEENICGENVSVGIGYGGASAGTARAGTSAWTTASTAYTWSSRPSRRWKGTPVGTTPRPASTTEEPPAERPARTTARQTGPLASP